MGYSERKSRDSKFSTVSEIDCGADCAQIDNKGNNYQDKRSMMFGEVDVHFEHRDNLESRVLDSAVKPQNDEVFCVILRLDRRIQGMSDRRIHVFLPSHNCSHEPISATVYFNL